MTAGAPSPGSTDERMVPCAPPLTMPPHPNVSHVFMTWRDAIAAAHQGIATAQDYRARLFREAAAAGLTRGEIGEACGLSPAAVQKIIGKDKRATLDSIVGESS